MRSLIFASLVAALLAACGSVGKNNDKGFYGGDSGPSGSRDFASIPDAIPKSQPLSRSGNKPYTVFGKRYIPLKSSKGFKQTGTASWYGKKFHGRRTSSGEKYNMWAMTAAHPTLPLPTYVRVTHLESNKSIVVKVNDRGPFLHNRVIDLSYAAAHKLGIANQGVGKVKVVAINPSRPSVPVASVPVASVPAVPVPAPLLDESAYVAKQGSVGSNIFIQIGAFADKSNALSARSRIEFLGYPVYPKSENELFNQPLPLQIQAGPFSDSAKAKAAKLDLEQWFGYKMLFVFE